MEDTLAPSNDLPARHRERLEIAHRNSLRLLKLVNTLLDFSRIEARRIQAVYEPTDLGPYTSELASVFRSAVEKAGLKLIVCCPPLGEPVYVDREMWEKIVLNLLSNAFKFTFQGEIKVSLQQQGEAAELIVSDTGTGIPDEELPHLFERFHRVKGARGRTFEGSGIGLALVQELVKLHGGSIDIQSELDRGSAFRLRIPLGTKHLPADRIGAARTQSSTSLRGETFVEEALTWLPEVPLVNDPLSSDGHSPNWSATMHDAAVIPDKSRVLLAEDNADMRAYVCRMLSERYEVEAVPNGLAALEAARRNPPAIILSDVMMPEMDGFELVREVRGDERLQDLPIILLSARAGEEARVEGVTQGADDYLTKPFSARELLARVATHLQLARVRRQAEASLRESEERLRQLNEQLEQRVAARTAALQTEVFERRAAEEQIKNLLRQLVTAEEQERRRIARELHDTLGQQLASLHLSIEVLKTKADSDATVHQHIERMRQTFDHVNSHLDFLAWELRPPALDMLGLDAALESYVQEWSQLFEIEAEYQGLGVQGLRFAPEAETNLYRVFQEVLQNVYKHAGAKQVHVIFERRGGDALLIVEDNGKGYDTGATRNARDGIGLINIRERAALIGGSIQIESEPGQGTTVYVRVPIAVESIEGRPAGEAAVVAVSEKP